MDTRLFDARFWPILVNVTDDPTYRPLIVLIDNLREALELKNLPHGPFIDLLLALYKDEGSAGDKVVDLRPELPTDDDIMDFFRSHWPVLIFTRPREGAPFTWKSIGTSELMEYDRFVDSQSVPILGMLVDHWQELSLSGTTEGQAPLEAVAVLILGVLLHELGTGILAWWVRESRDVDVVKLGGILGDAGSFVESQIFGGSLEGWWGKDGTVGNLLEMECVVVVTADERIRKIDKDIATRIFSCLTGRLTIPAVDFSSDTSDLIPPSTAAQYRRVRMTTFLDRGDSATQ